jgi:biopolymer transport protein TolQ
MAATNAAAGLDFVQLFMHSDWVIKIVMIALVLGSLWSWAVIIQKVLLLGKVNKEADGFEGVLASGRPLDDIAAGLGSHPKEPFQKLLVIVTRVWRDNKSRSLSGAQGDIVLNQADRELNHVISSEAETMEQGLSLLAVIATASPFIGLFGTVWGIMNAFSAIASQGDTNLATVAPAISEALFATALGLAAAIPAYIGYNLFNTKIARFVARMEGFADELMVSLTRRVGDKIAS